MRYAPRFLVCFGLGLTAVGFAQSTPKATAAPEDFGSVAGRVICADTQRPARLAEVRLVPVALTQAEQPSGKEAGPSPALGNDLPPIETDMDGRFVAPHIKPGRYYVRIDLDGYITPLLSFTPAQLRHPTPDIQERLRSELTQVTVQPHAPTEVELTLARGGSVSGNVLYDDGTPAISVQVTLLRKDTDGSFTQDLSSTGRILWPTDERGRFHFSSLPPGEYIAQATLALREHSVSSMPMPTGGGVMEVSMVKTSFELPVASSPTHPTPRTNPRSAPRPGRPDRRAEAAHQLP